MRKIDLLTPHEDVSTATVANFAQSMAGVFAAYNAENAMIDDLFTCLSNFLPGINWPVTKSRKDAIKNDLSSYVDVDARSLKFDVCGSGCVCGRCLNYGFTKTFNCFNFRSINYINTN